MNGDLSEISSNLRQAYNREELRLLDRALVTQVFSDKLDVSLLCEAGVPCVEEFEISFNLADRLPLLRDYLAGEIAYSPEWPSDVRCLNEKEDFVIGIDKGREDAVICIDLTGKWHAALILNSKIRYFIAFLAECRLHLHRTRTGLMDRERSFEMASDQMRKWDPSAVNQGWWQGIFDIIYTYG